MSTNSATIADYSANRLANEAGCSGPDSPTSPGARFLESVRDATLEAVEYAGDDGIGDEHDAAHEIADAAVPVYTHELWQTFTDLGAYTEDPTELGADASDMEQAAKVCLYMIAERLAVTLLEEAAGAEEDDEDDE